MQTAIRSMSRRYRYEPRMSARELSEAMNRVGISARQLARISGAAPKNVDRWLKDGDIPIYVQRDLWIWSQDAEAYRLAIDWANEHAHDVRDDE